MAEVDRAAARQILTDIVAQGLTPELRQRAHDYLGRKKTEDEGLQ